MHAAALVALFSLAPAHNGAADASCDDIRRVRASLVSEGLDDTAVAALEGRRCTSRSDDGGARRAMSGDCYSLSVMAALSSMSDGDDRDAVHSAVDGMRTAVCAMGEKSTLASTTYWPNGKLQRNGSSSWYWPNGKLAQNGATSFYYPNGKIAQNGSTSWYWPNGRLAQNGSTTFYTQDGKVTDAVNLIAAGCAAQPGICDRRNGRVDVNDPLTFVRLLAVIAGR